MAVKGLLEKSADEEQTVCVCGHTWVGVMQAPEIGVT